MAIHSQIDSVKQRLQDLQTLNISIAEQNKAGHLKLEAHLRQSFRTLYACNVAYLNILLKKEEDQKNGMKASGQKLSFLAVMTSVIQTVGGGLAGGLGAVIAISCKAAERNKSVSDSYQQGIGHNPSYAAPLPNSPVCYKPVTADVDGWFYRDRLRGVQSLRSEIGCGTRIIELRAFFSLLLYLLLFRVLFCIIRTIRSSITTN
jgi:hypothetical protein